MNVRVLRIIQIVAIGPILLGMGSFLFGFFLCWFYPRAAASRPTVSAMCSQGIGDCGSTRSNAW